jgi:hypothetical protein
MGMLLGILIDQRDCAVVASVIDSYDFERDGFVFECGQYIVEGGGKALLLVVARDDYAQVRDG